MNFRYKKRQRLNYKLCIYTKTNEIAKKKSSLIENRRKALFLMERNLKRNLKLFLLGERKPEQKIIYFN